MMQTEIYLENLLQNIKSRGVTITTEDGYLDVESPDRKLSPELVEILRIHKAEIIRLLTAPVKIPDPLRDFCAVCRSLLVELANGEWECSTIGCTDARIKEAREFFGGQKWKS